MDDHDALPVTMAWRRLEKYDEAGALLEVVEQRDGEVVVITPASEDWPRVVAAIQAEE